MTPKRRPDALDRPTDVHPLVDFLAKSPLATSIAAGHFGDPDVADIFPRALSFPRRIDLG